MNRPKEMLNDTAIVLLATGLILGLALRAMDWIRPAVSILGW